MLLSVHARTSCLCRKAVSFFVPRWACVCPLHRRWAHAEGFSGPSVIPLPWMAPIETRRSWVRAFVELSRESGRGSGSADVIAYTKAIHAGGRAGRWATGLGVLGSLRECRCLDVIGCNSLLAVCQRCEQWSLTLALLGSMGQQHFVPSVFGTFSFFLCVSLSLCVCVCVCVCVCLGVSDILYHTGIGFFV